MSLHQDYTGRAHYYPDHRSGPHRLFVAVACLVEDVETPVRALLDTGSEWCVLPSGIAVHLGFDLAADRPQVRLLTRFGTIEGRMERVRIGLLADEGDTLDVEASCFISPDWPGPMVIGWKGCLEWLRFALDPGENGFYFASL